MRTSGFLRLVRLALLCGIASGCALVTPPEAPERRGSQPPSSASATEPLLSLELHGMESQGLLARLRQGFSLPDPGGSEVRYYERWYGEHPAALDHLAEPGGWYLPYIARAVSARGMPAEIALLPAVESEFDATARSPSGAAGLWQFTGRTARQFGLRQDSWIDQRMNLESSTRAALDYLAALHRRFRGDWLLALAAYNAGEGKVRRVMEGNINRGRPANFRFLDLPRETRHFVPRLIALRNVLREPARYGVTLPTLTDEIRFTHGEATRQLHHVQVARACGIDADLVSQINAGQVRRATPPGGPHRVRLPRDCEFAPVAAPPRPDDPRLAPFDRTYVVRSGDSLWRIARVHGLSLAALGHANPGIGADLVPGQRIVLPDATPPDTDIREIVHRVKRGDTLTRLAARYRVSAQSIARWNRLSLQDTLNLGQRIRIYPR